MNAEKAREVSNSAFLTDVRKQIEETANVGGGYLRVGLFDKGRSEEWIFSVIKILEADGFDVEFNDESLEIWW